MTVKNMFSDNGPLSGLKEKSRKKFLDMGKVGFLGVDTSIYLHQWCSHDSTAMPNTAIPRYQSKDIEYKIMALHNELCKKADTVVYFFEGVDLPLKSQTKLERKKNVDSQKAKLDGLVAKYRRGGRITDDDRKSIKACRRAISVPDEIIYGQVILFMKKNKMIVFGAPGEAEHQMVEFQNSGYLDTIITRDADLVALGAESVILDLKLNDNPKASTYVEYTKTTVIEDDKYSIMKAYKDCLPELACLLGTDYIKRIPNHGPGKVLGTSTRKDTKKKKVLKNSTNIRHGQASRNKEDSIMDQFVNCESSKDKEALLLSLEAKGVFQGPKKKTERYIHGYFKAEDHFEYINSLLENIPPEVKVDISFVGWSRLFPRAVGMFRHCPVFKLMEDSTNFDFSDPATWKFKVAPLQRLPSKCSSNRSLAQICKA